MFAGSGSLGLEALSRGAGRVCFVDKSIGAIKLIKHNIGIVGIDRDSYNVIRDDAERFLKKSSEYHWDIVFLDPPYKISEAKMAKIFGILALGQIIDKQSIIVYEYFFKKNIYHEIKKLNIIKEYHYGDKKVSYLKL